MLKEDSGIEDPPADPPSSAAAAAATALGLGSASHSPLNSGNGAFRYRIYLVGLYVCTFACSARTRLSPFLHRRACVVDGALLLCMRPLFAGVAYRIYEGRYQGAQ